MRYLLVLLVTLLLINGCGGDERLEIKSKDVKTKDLVKDKVITNDERLDYLAYDDYIRYKDKQEYAKLEEETFASVLAKAKKFKADVSSDNTRKRDMEIFQMFHSVREIRDVVDVTLLSGRYVDYGTWKFKVQINNKSSEPIQSIKGTYYVYNTFDDYLGEFNIRFKDGIPPQDSLIWESERSWINSDYNKLLREAFQSENLKGLDTSFWPEKIVFVNGKSIEVIEPKEKNL